MALVLVPMMQKRDSGGQARRRVGRLRLARGMVAAVRLLGLHAGRGFGFGHDLDGRLGLAGLESCCVSQLGPQGCHEPINSRTRLGFRRDVSMSRPRSSRLLARRGGRRRPLACT